MWFFTAYVIWGLSERRGSISIPMISYFIFEELWKHGIVINDSEKELEHEINYLSSIGAIEIEGQYIRVKEDRMRELLRAIGNIRVEEYLRKIDRVIAEA